MLPPVAPMIRRLHAGISERNDFGHQSRVKAKLESEGYQVVTAYQRYLCWFDGLALDASESDIFVVSTSIFQAVQQHRGIRNLLLPTLLRYHRALMRPTMLIRRVWYGDTLANASVSLINATGAQNQGVASNLRSLAWATAPAVLLELGFCQIHRRSSFGSTSDYQETLANAIVAGIKSYYEKNLKV